jgi:hypothetical protein
MPVARPSSGRTARHLVLAAAVCAGLVGIGAGAVLFSIETGVRGYAGDAQRLHPRPGDDGAALLALLADESRSIRERNHAVWALGRLREARALPALQAARHGGPYDHERALCQRELAKAIRRCGAETPAPSLALP